MGGGCAASSAQNTHITINLEFLFLHERTCFKAQQRRDGGKHLVRRLLSMKMNFFLSAVIIVFREPRGGSQVVLAGRSQIDENRVGNYV